MKRVRRAQTVSSLEIFLLKIGKMRSPNVSVNNCNIKTDTFLAQALYGTGPVRAFTTPFSARFTDPLKSITRLHFFAGRIYNALFIFTRAVTRVFAALFARII